MELMYLGVVFLFGLLLLLGTGVWIGLALIGCAWLVLSIFIEQSAGEAMITVMWSTSTSWSLTALPLFIWMGEILYRTRLSENLFKGLAPWMDRIPGGLLHTNIVGCTLFAAISGSSAATLTTVGKMTMPQLRQRKYPEHMVVGTLAGAATLGLMIPPSLTLIVYGVTVNESLTKLFMAGIIPGLVLAGLFMGYIVIWAKYVDHIGASTPPPKSNWQQRIQALKHLLPLIALIGLVIGSMYAGIATATEAAAIGVVGAMGLATVEGSFNWHNLKTSLLGSVRTSALSGLILMGASFLAWAMGWTGLPRMLAQWIDTLQLTPLTLIFALTLFYIVVGMFLDGISAVVLTMAVVEPMIRAAGIDVIWFGIFIVVVVEMAQITPPVGFNLFVLQGITKHEVSYIAKAAFPMFLLMALMVVILVIFPGLATWLPYSM
jgi:tripartite ATP-independent transporter DctM subunit